MDRTMRQLGVVALAAALLACSTRVEVGDGPIPPGPGGDAVSPPSSPPAAAPTCGPCSAGEICGQIGSTPSCVPEWGESQTLTLDFAQADAAFGIRSIARTDTRLVIGAQGEGTTDGQGAGAAYVFERGVSGWLRGQRLEPAAPSAGKHFGSATAITNDVIVVGASGEAGVNGAVHVFELRDGFWTDAAQLVPPSTSNGFGCALALAGDTLAVGSLNGLDLYARVGSSYVHRSSHFAGESVCRLAASSDAIAVSKTSTGTNVSEVFTMLRSSAGWGTPFEVVRTAPFTSGTVLARQPSVSVDGMRLAVGVHSTPEEPGRIALFDLTTGAPVQSSVFVEPTPPRPWTFGSMSRGFGATVALREDRVATAGQVFRPSLGWTKEDLIFDSPFLATDKKVDASMSVLLGADEVFFTNGDGVIRGILGADSQTQWSALTKLTASESTSSPSTMKFGAHVALGTDVALVRGRVSGPSPSDYERTFLFEKRDGRWRFKQTIERPNPSNGDWADPVFSGSTLAMGWQSTREIRSYGRGADGLWSLEQTIRSPLPGPSKSSASLALSGDVLVSAEARTLIVYERPSGGARTFAQTQRFDDIGDVSDVVAGPDRIVATIWESSTQRTLRTYVRTKDGAWQAAGTISLQGNPNEAYSSDVALAPDGLVVLEGATLRAYERSGDAWAAKSSIAAPKVTKLTAAGDGWLLGASRDGTGKVTSVTRNGDFRIGATFASPGAVGAAEFGMSVAGTPASFLVGAPGEGGGGRVHVFDRASAAAPPR